MRDASEHGRWDESCCNADNRLSLSSSGLCHFGGESSSSSRLSSTPWITPQPGRQQRAIIAANITARLPIGAMLCPLTPSVSCSRRRLREFTTRRRQSQDDPLGSHPFGEKRKSGRSIREHGRSGSGAGKMDGHRGGNAHRQAAQMAQGGNVRETLDLQPGDH